MSPVADEEKQTNEDKEVTSETDVTSVDTKAGTMSANETMVHLLKGNIGSGIFSMPFAFSEAGLWFGLFGLPFMALICTHCMQLLVRTAKVMKERQGNFIVNYADVAEAVCVTGTKRIRKHGVMLRKIVNTFICVTQIGFCCIYLVFVSNNIQEVFSHFFPDLGWSIPIYMGILTVPLIFLNWIRNLKLLAPISAVGNVLQLFNIIVVFYYTCQDLPSVSTRPAIGPLDKMPLFFATSIFTFEGIALVLPIQNDMKHPQDFPGRTGLLNVAMTLVTIIYVAVGFFGYLKYGEAVNPTVTLNLPEGDILAIMVKISTVLAVFASYAMQFYVPIPILMPILTKKLSCIGSDFIIEYGYRTIMVLVIFGAAAAIPKLDLFISLVGAIGSSFLGVIFPAMLDILADWPNISRIRLTKDSVIIIFGLLGFVTGTWTSIERLIIEFSPSQ